MGGKEEIRFELKITYSNTMMNCWLSQKLKLLENCELNHLLIILMVWNKKKHVMVFQLETLYWV